MPEVTDREHFDRALRRLAAKGWRILGSAPRQSPSPILAVPENLETSFDSHGVLRSDVTVYWRFGLASKVQTEFARESLVVRIPLAQDEGEGVCLAGHVGDSDLCRIALAMDGLAAQGYIAEPNFSLTSSGGWSDIHERSTGNVKALFWNSQSHDECFDEDGNLIDDLSLQWSGDPVLIEQALAATGLTVDAPANERGTFYLGPDADEL